MTATITHPDLLHRGLPKWPALLVQGRSVTREQAMEILLRTNDTYFSTNDREFLASVLDTLGISVAADRSYLTPDWNSLREFFESIHHLDLHYLTNSRIVSAWIGGPHGWCNWDGAIFSANYNIGKWPSVGEVLSDWTTIAQAFPFLSLRSQLMSGETSEENTEPVVEFVVENAHVTLTKPEALLTPIQDDAVDSFVTRFEVPGRERGCTPALLSEALEYVRSRLASTP